MFMFLCAKQSPFEVRLAPLSIVHEDVPRAAMSAPDRHISLMRNTEWQFGVEWWHYVTDKDVYFVDGTRVSVLPSLFFGLGRW